jgi:hypothetical protein
MLDTQPTTKHFRRQNVVLFSLFYTTIVFGAGTIFTSIRILFIQPRIGDRYGQLLQAPVMLYTMRKMANDVVHKLNASEHAEQSNSSKKFNDGRISFLSTATGKKGYYLLGLYSLVQVLVLVAAYYVLMILLEASEQHTTIWKLTVKWLQDTDIVCGLLFIAMLGVFALLPAWVSRDSLSNP